MSENRNWQEWRRENENTNWPFQPNCSLTSVDNKVLLPGQIVDVVLHPIGGVGPFYLSSIELNKNKAKLYFGDSKKDKLCFVEFDWTNPPEQLDIKDEYGIISGLIILNTIAIRALGSWGDGEHEFKLKETELVAAVCCPMPERGVRGILLDSGELVTGEVWIAGGPGVVVRPELIILKDEQGNDYPAIAINISVVGDPYFRRRMCGDDRFFSTPRFIRKVRVIHDNGQFVCPPDMIGNLAIETNDALTLRPSLRIQNSSDGIRFMIAGGEEDNG